MRSLPPWLIGRSSLSVSELFRRTWLQMLLLRATSSKWSRSSRGFSKRTRLNPGFTDGISSNYPSSLLLCWKHLAWCLTSGQSSWMWTLNRERNFNLQDEQGMGLCVPYLPTNISSCSAGVFCRSWSDKHFHSADKACLDALRTALGSSWRQGTRRFCRWAAQQFSLNTWDINSNLAIADRNWKMRNLEYLSI